MTCRIQWLAYDPHILRCISIYRSPEVKTYILEHHGKYLTPIW
jgi:hypothetical protein